MMDEKNLLMAVAIISTILLGLTVIMQFGRKKYREAILNLIYAVAFFGFMLGMYHDMRTVSAIALAVIIPVTICQAIFAYKEYKKHRADEAALEEK
jgi:cbb3-type cytochrome oxidase subunit 3